MQDAIECFIVFQVWMYSIEHAINVHTLQRLYNTCSRAETDAQRVYKPLTCYSWVYLENNVGSRAAVPCRGSSHHCCWCEELEEEAGRAGWMQIGSLWGGVNVRSETKIITARLVTVSLALPLSWCWCFPLFPALPLFPLLFVSLSFSPTYNVSSITYHEL